MRQIWDFHGGIHPQENKHQSNQTAIASAGIPARLVLPLSQHIGAAAEPVVAVGDKVLKGQLIAQADGFVSAPVHASSSGTVVAIEERAIPHASGLNAPCVVIETDGLDQWTELKKIADYRLHSAEELIAIIGNAGITGMGGAGFPTSVKVGGAVRQTIETLIINGTECEPYITSDDCLMRERAEEIVAGAEILNYLVSATEVLIGVEDNKPEAIEALQQAAEGKNIEVVVFPTKYPSGGEKQLIEILTGKQVPSGGLPSDIGILCQNVGTSVAIYRAVTLGEPLISRITTLTGEAMGKPGNVEVLLGTPISDLVAHGDYRELDNPRLIMGGPMMGFTLPSADVPVIKTTNCILAPSPQELPVDHLVQACIRCGMCAEVCPASLLPQQLFWFAQGKEFEKLEDHNLFDCIECGACSWVCPSHIPLVQYYRASKAEIIATRTANEKSEHSRERFEARQARIERQEAEKAAKRAARKQAAEEKARAAAAEGDSTADPIQAAIERAKAKKAAQANAAPVDQKDKLENTVQTTRKRLATAESKLAAAEQEGSELVEALRTGVDKTREKLVKAEQALADYLAQQSDNADTNVEEVATGGAAAKAAIDKALAARAANASLSDEEKAARELEKLEQRLDKARSRLADSEANGDEDKIIDALKATVERLEGKLAAAREANTADEASA